MPRTINNQIECICKGITWLNASEKSENKKKREPLIEIRRRLKQIKYAEQVKPAVAVYGGSQVGKSYLVDGLLTGSNSRLKIVGGNGQLLSFIDELDPHGKGSESTSVITRFTSDNSVGENSKYPIKAILMSPVDVVLILCDGYYNDISDRKPFSTEEITKRIEDWKIKYTDSPVLQHYIEEDEIYDIDSYLSSDRNFSSTLREYQDLVGANYFQEVSKFIDRVPNHEWCAIFSILWGDSVDISAIFNMLIQSLSKLKFKTEVFIPIRSLQREYGTLLSVKRLDEFFGSIRINTIESEVTVLAGNEEIRLSKGEFCALSLEYIFKVDPEISREKDFLKSTDILDFPGARSRKRFSLKDLSDKAVTISNENDGEKKAEPHENRCQMLRRGKVAYFFNKYTDQYLINILLFCYEPKQNEVSSISKLLGSWVIKSIGNSPQKRGETISKLTISPLFIIGTKYNIDLSKDDLEYKDNNYKGINSRWENRFDTFLKSQVIETSTSTGSWFEDWTIENKAFNNIYLLRSYDFSLMANIFKGNRKTIKNAEGLDISVYVENGYGDAYETHLKKVEESFIKYPFVQKHFVNPAETWEETSTINKDGSQLIIRNLSIASRNAFMVRKNQFAELIIASYMEVLAILDASYRTENKDMAVLEALYRAGQIQLALDALFENNESSFSFSKFISTFHVCESELLNLILNELRNPDITSKSGTRLLWMIRYRANITVEDNEASALEKIHKAYHFPSLEKTIGFLQEKGISIESLIDPPPSKSLSIILGELVENYWFTYKLIPERFAFLSNEISLIDELLAYMKNLYSKKLEVTKELVKKMDPYVTETTDTEKYVDMLADISSEMINRFVNEMGYSYYSDARWEELSVAKEKNKLEINIDRKQFEEEGQPGIDRMQNILKVIDNPTDEEKRSMPYSMAHLRWTKLMKIGFLATCDIPDYDPEENARLRLILTQLAPENPKYQTSQNI